MDAAQLRTLLRDAEAATSADAVAVLVHACLLNSGATCARDAAVRCGASHCRGHCVCVCVYCVLCMCVCSVCNVCGGLRL